MPTRTQREFSGSASAGSPGEAVIAPYLDGGFALWSGTSMASPMVAGGAALLLAEDDDLETDDIRELLDDSADPVDHDGGAVGEGRIQLDAALDLLEDH